MSEAGAAKTFGTNRNTRIAVNRLMELLEIFYPDPHPDLFTINSFLYTYKISGLSEAAIRRIEQSRRINIGLDQGQGGLNFFHTGLIYFHEGELYAAEEQFDNALKKWSLENNPALDCLVFLGKGFAQEIAFRYEDAMQNYRNAERALTRLKQRSSKNAKQVQFINESEGLIQASFEQLRKIMWPIPEPAAEEPAPQDMAAQPDTETADPDGAPESEPAEGPEPDQPDQPVEPSDWPRIFPDVTAVPPPHSPTMEIEPMPIDGHIKQKKEYQWYQVEQRSADQQLAHIRKGDWLLVYTKLEATSGNLPQNVPLIVMYESEIDGTIMLKRHKPLQQSPPSQRIHLKRLTVETGKFVKENDHIIFTKEEQQEEINFADILGVVVGLWRPVTSIDG